MERLYQAFAFNEAEPLIFTQLDFWLFFLAVMIIFSMIHKNFLVRSFFLTVISLFFYFKTSGLYVLLLGLSLVGNYLLGNAIFKSRSETSKKWIIAASSIFNLSMLGYFKYAYFFTDSYNKMTGKVVWSDELQEGYMTLSNLPVNDPSKKQYQLWIVDPTRDTKPVDGGVFDIPEGQSTAVIAINNPLVITNPKAFVITMEQPGGVVVSKQQDVVAIAKAS